jgi:hypothetical protein
MMWGLLWNEHPPIARAIFIFSAFLGLLVLIEPDVENKMYLLDGHGSEIWRYVTQIFFMGKLSVKFFVRWAI